jgi:hypothetical protein
MLHAKTAYKTLFFMPTAGLEPETFPLPWERSTN